MVDRFGAIPPEVEDLFTTVRCRRIAVELGFEKIVLKNETVKFFFVSNPESAYFNSDTFKGILKFIQTQTNKARLKQVGKNGILIVEKMRTMAELLDFLTRLEASID
jgi:transcription-repair coupling factor (superfamily II helicase)